jgi:hypothetical protein
LTKAPKDIMAKRQPFQQMLLGKLDICMPKTESRFMFFTLQSINSKWIEVLNIRPKTLKLVQEKSKDYIGINSYKQ